MDNRILNLVTVVALALALPVVARADVDDDYRTTSSNGHYADAKVLKVEPIVRTVRVSEPRRECWDEDYVVERPSYRHGDAAGNMVLGGIIGGVIGNAFGQGHGRGAATAAGVLIGSAIGHDQAVEREDGDRYASDERRTRTRCDVSDVWHEEERTDGYRVTYEFQGERYTTRMNRDPGDKLKVWVSFRVVGY